MLLRGLLISGSQDTVKPKYKLRLKQILDYFGEYLNTIIITKNFDKCGTHETFDEQNFDELIVGFIGGKG